MGEVTAVLMDTVSIQKYIFSSNSLKENVGASYLVKNIYKDHITETLRKIFGDGGIGSSIDIDYWKQHQAEYVLKEKPAAKYEIAYIGGGNALLLFRESDKAVAFIKNWTKSLLVKTPGLQTAVASASFALEGFYEADFNKNLQSLYQKLAENKNKYFPSTFIPKYGITADCQGSGFSAEIYDKSKGEEKYISTVSHMKRRAADKAQAETEERYKDILAGKYTFSTEIDKLGQQEGESHLAIVHIDGNNMASKFENCKTLVTRRKLSFSVDEAAKEAFVKLLKAVKVYQQDYFTKKDSGFRVQQVKGKQALVIRPIILGGDDITFVTDGRLGVHLAEKFIGYFTDCFEKTEARSDLKEHLTASAGVSIIRTKYPFFSGYKIAEGLCKEAKEEARRHKDTSWLSFNIAYGGLSATSMESIREKHHRVNGESLYFGPYCLDEEQQNAEKSIRNLKEGIKEFGDKEKWARSKVKELRTVLSLGKIGSKKFIDEMKAKDLELPGVTGGTDYRTTGWENARTPYFDMVELIEFYPQYFLKKDDKKNFKEGEEA